MSRITFRGRCVIIHTVHACCSVEWLVLDEADKLFEDGPSKTGFREQVSTRRLGVYTVYSGVRQRAIRTVCE